MTKDNFTTKKREYKHLSDVQRGKLEEMARLGTYTQKEMGLRLGVNQSTISRELRRGRTRQMDYKHQYYDCYTGDSGARVYKENRLHSKSKGIEKYSARFFDELVAALKVKKIERIFSVDTFVHFYKKNHPAERVPCTRTVYKIIDSGDLTLRNIDLPMKTRMRPRKLTPSKPKGKNTKNLGRSIEQRPEEVLTRESFGHWELDLVIGKKTKGEPVIITMVERKTRTLLTKKVWSKSAEAIQKHVLQMIQKQGTSQFESITTDNGPEFSSLSLLESTLEAIQIFFAHAYASWEKGSNERHNRILREFLPKGHSFRNLTYNQLSKITNAINLRPRKILNYDSPTEALSKEFNRIKVA